MAKWEIDENYDASRRPGAWTIVPYDIGPAGPSADVNRPAPSSGAGTGALHPLTILLNAAGALRRGADALAPAVPATPVVPAPSAPAPPPPGPPVMPGPSADADRPVVAPPVNDDLFGRFLRGVMDANPILDAIPPEQKARALSIFRLAADRAWRDNSALGAAVSNVESGRGINQAPRTITYTDHTGRVRTEQAGGDIYGMGYTPEEYAANAAEAERRDIAYRQRQAQKRDQQRALGPMTTADDAVSLISSLFGSLLSPEIAIGPGAAAYSRASTVGKAALGAGANAATVGITDPIAQAAAVQRGDRQHYSPAEHAMATAGAAALGGLIPALGALARRFGALREAPRVEAPPEAPPARPAEPDAKPDVRYTEEGVPIIRITPEKKVEATAPEPRRAPETIELPSRPLPSESASAIPETVRPGEAAVAPAPSPTPSRTATPDAPRIVSGDGAPAEVGYIASPRGLPERFATKAEAERAAAESAGRITADDPLRRQVVAAAHPSGDGFAVAVRRAPESATPKAKTAELPKGEGDAPLTRAAEPAPDSMPESRPAEASPAHPPQRGPDQQTDAEFLRELEGNLAYAESVGRRTDLSPDDRAEVARLTEQLRGGVEQFRAHVAEKEARASARAGAESKAETAKIPKPAEPEAGAPVRGNETEAREPGAEALPAREAADQAAGARRAAARLEREAEAEVTAARAEVEAAQAELRRLKGAPAEVEAPAAAYNEALRRQAPDLEAKEAQLAKLEAALTRKRNPVKGEKRAGMERQAERLREAVATMRRQASPDGARATAATVYGERVRAADARVTAANERLRAAEERLDQAGARTERRGNDEVTKEYRARDAEEAAGVVPKAASDVPAHMQSDRFPGGSSTLYANPFGDPRIYRHVAPELVGALTGGFVGEYAETGQVGFSLKWALAGAFAMSGAMRLPIKGRTLLGKDSWAMRSAEKAGDAMAAVPVLRTLHPRGGVTAELWDKIQRAHVETRNMQADAAARARYMRDHFTADERALMSDWVERQEQARYGMHGFETASFAVRDQAEQLSRHADEMGAELVALKMLDPAAFERLKGQYLHRYYAPHAADDAPSSRTARKQVTATYSRRRGETRPDVENTRGFKEGDSVLQMVRPDDGETRFVGAAEGKRLEDEGFVHGKTWTVEAVRDGKMDLHRDFSPIERQAMGEIRDAGYRYARGVIEASRDLALGRLYKDIAANPEWASAAPKDGWHKVADTTVSGSVVKKFGALGGLYVEPRVWSALMAVRRPWTELENETLNGVVRGYLKAFAAWKLGKTAYNPATHFNNVAGNVALSMLSGKVGPADVLRAVRAMGRKDSIVEEARRAGLSIGQEANLGDEFGGFARELGDMTGVEPRHGWLRVMGWFTDRFTNNKLTRLYQREDSLFKLAAYMAERRAGVSPEDAVKEAHRWFFDYRDVPVGVQFMRDAPLPIIGLPFFTYTYKVVQALGRVAIESPHRMLAAYGILSGIDMASYGFLYGDKAGAGEAYEREMLPEYHKGRNAFGAQRMLRLPWDETDPKTGEKRPAFLNTRYFLPGGDLLDFTGQAKFGPELYPAVFGNTILGGNPLVVALAGAWSGKDTFTGKDIYPYPDTSLFDWQKRPTHEVAANFRALVRFFAFQALPPIVTTVPDRLGNAAVGEGAIGKDGALADFFGWTGTDYAGREKSVGKTLASVFGIKLEDMGLEEQHRFRQIELQRDVRDTLMDARRVHRSEATTEAQRRGQVDALRARVAREREESARIDELRRAAGR